jgi:hypothetical protein
MSNDIDNNNNRAREAGYHTFDPEHMICNGAGGAFLHPTHMFAPAGRLMGGALGRTGGTIYALSCFSGRAKSS